MHSLNILFAPRFGPFGLVVKGGEILCYDSKERCYAMKARGRLLSVHGCYFRISELVPSEC